MQEIESLQLSLPADKKYLGLLGNVVQEVCQQVPGLSASTGYNVQLAVDEAVVNVITHAYHDDPAGRIELAFDICVDRLIIKVRDWGDSFDPDELPDPDPTRPDASGYGVYLIRRLMDAVVYQATSTGNCVTMTKLAL